MSGGQSYFSKTEIKDIFAYLKLVTNPDDDNAFLRVINTPRRGIGVATLEKLALSASEQHVSLFNACTLLKTKAMMKEAMYEKLEKFHTYMLSLAQKIYQGLDVRRTLMEMVDAIDYQGYLYQSINDPKRVEKKMATIYDFIDWIDKLMYKDKPLPLEDVVLKLSLIDVMDRGEEESTNEVQLLTLHAAKGLEYPYVFLVGMEEELLPHKTSIEEDNIEEERRLMYVGMTRAQRCLTMTLAKTRKRFGETIDSVPSRFIDEIPKETLQIEGDGSETITPSKGKTHLAGLKALLETS